MPLWKTIEITDYEGNPKSYKIRSFMPTRIRNQMMNLQTEIEQDKRKPTDLQEYIICEMTLDESKITKEKYNSDEMDCNEMDQLFEAIMRQSGFWIDPKDLIGKTKEEQIAIASELKTRRIDEIKKKQTNP